MEELGIHDHVIDWSGFWQKSGSYWLLAVALLVVIGGVFYWAVVIRKRRNRHSVCHRTRHHSSSESGVEPRKEGMKVRKRRRRSSHPRYPRNPTLAETGGLPPVRKDEPPGPAGWPKD